MRTGMVTHLGVIQIIPVNPFVIVLHAHDMNTEDAKFE